MTSKLVPSARKFRWSITTGHGWSVCPVYAISSISKVSTYLNGRLIISSPYLNGDESIVSRERVNDFKNWLDK